MDVGMAIHKALDYFFCDRCVAEGLENFGGKSVESKVASIIDKICPVQFMFRFLPDEETANPRRIFFPRSWLEGSKHHKECGLH